MELLVALVVMVLASANPKLLLDHLALPELLAPLDLRETLEILANLELPADLDHKDLLVSMVLPDREVLLASVDQMEALELQVALDSPELRERLDLTEHLVAMEAQEPQAEMVSTEHLDLKGQRANLAPLVKL